MMNDFDGYIRKDEHGVLRVGGTRVMFDSVVAAFEQGHSPEMIRQQYPSLSLAEFYGAITWYLAHPDEAQAYLAQQDRVWEDMRAKAEQRPAEAVERLRKLRETEATKSIS
jgi:uncharacterized protein (DUF433 family)